MNGDSIGIDDFDSGIFVLKGSSEGRSLHWYLELPCSKFSLVGTRLKILERVTA